MSLKNIIIYIFIACLFAVLTVFSTLLAKYNYTKEPNQKPATIAKPIIINYSGCTFKLYPMADYTIKAQLKSKKTYTDDWKAMISHYDLCLAWGDLALTSSKKIKFSQRDRWCYFKYVPGFPLDGEYILPHYSNNHIIYSNPKIKTAIEEMKINEVVKLSGQLVNTKGRCKNGKTYDWKTSVSRQDIGGGACEVFFVTKAVVGGRAYQ